ncbi:hypothetical protein [Pannonibacter sp. SL95]|uniref:hypothetical protein n=1 Tax=Pannonibacter sp. SL95 TaxID=2995153 RepID=UPI00227622D6|nr:hypothetical protein [Pannonibacter sp. SL95]MCY1707694.1 hypothetical protein [Pannonibacter sp. SL95]MCY1707746.1 hypothetical protein [Pannonibacter sp. SL95]
MTNETAFRFADHLSTLCAALGDGWGWTIDAEIPHYGQVNSPDGIVFTAVHDANKRSVGLYLTPPADHGRPMSVADWLGENTFGASIAPSWSESSTAELAAGLVEAALGACHDCMRQINERKSHVEAERGAVNAIDADLAALGFLRRGSGHNVSSCWVLKSGRPGSPNRASATVEFEMFSERATADITIPRQFVPALCNFLADLMARNAG